jgi:predicted anti-sigma-YlaC factor YlaD
MSSETITCKEVMSHICDNRGVDDGSECCRRVMEHLRSCEKCRNYFASVEKTIDYFKADCAQITPDCHKRLMEFLNLDE